MDRLRFGQLTRPLWAESGSRRSALGTVAAAIGGGASALLVPSGGFAKKRKKKKKKKLTPAYACPGPATDFAGFLPSGRVGQLFTATRSGTLRQVRIDVFKDIAATPGDFVVQLLEVNGAVPDNSPLAVLAVSTVPGESVPNGVSTLVANFSGPRLEQSVQYGVVVARPDSNTIAVPRTSSNVCEGQLTAALNAAAAFSNEAGQDVVV